MAPLLFMSAVELGYGNATVLRVDELAIRQTDSWFVLGPNGAGKSTLLRTVMGLLTPRSGRIERDETRMKPECIGFVPQDGGTGAPLPTTLREFVSLGLVGLRVNRDERARRVHEALESVGMPHLARSDFWTLSGGQRQRARLARALAREPILLVLDEPTNGLDPAAEEALLGIVDGLRRESHLTTIFVTHDVSLAARHASHVALLWDGQLACGPRESMLTDGPLRAAFGINPLRVVP